MNILTPTSSLSPLDRDKLTAIKFVRKFDGSISHKTLLGFNGVKQSETHFLPTALSFFNLLAFFKFISFFPLDLKTLMICTLHILCLKGMSIVFKCEST